MKRAIYGVLCFVLANLATASCSLVSPSADDKDATSLPLAISVQNLHQLAIVDQWKSDVYLDLAWAPTSEIFATADRDSISTYTVHPSQKHAFKTSELSFTGLAFYPNSSTLVSTGHGIEFWDLAGGQLTKRIVDEKCSTAGRIAFSPEGTMLVTGSSTSGAGAPSSTALYLWDVSTGSCIGKLAEHGGQLTSMSISSNGKWLVEATDGDIYLWNLVTRQQQCHFQGLYVAALSPDDKTLAIPDPQGIALKDTLSCESTLTLEGNPAVTSLAYSPDGRLLASGSIELPTGVNHVQFWDSDTGELKYDLKDFQSEPVSLAFSPNGQYLTSVFHRMATLDPASIVLWNIQP